MKVMLKTKETLHEEGFKESWQGLYIGEKRQPEALVKRPVIPYLGTEVEIIEFDWDDYTRDRMEIKIGQSRITIPAGIVALADLRRLVKKPTIFKVRGRRNSDSEAKFHPEIGFRFDCGLSELNTENARKLATWILKVSK